MSFAYNPLNTLMLLIGIKMNACRFSIAAIPIAAILHLTSCTNNADILPNSISSPVTAVEQVNTGAIDGKAQSKLEKRLVLTKTSTPQAMQLAATLKKANAKVYTAYWCPHCHDQGELFGKDAFAIVAPIECSKDGKNAQVALCREASNAANKAGEKFGFPTWEINGQYYPGVKTLDELSAIVK